jgi:hypothetical protein
MNYEIRPTTQKNTLAQTDDSSVSISPKKSHVMVIERLFFGRWWKISFLKLHPQAVRSAAVR